MSYRSETQIPILLVSLDRLLRSEMCQVLYLFGTTLSHSMETNCSHYGMQALDCITYALCHVGSISLEYMFLIPFKSYFGLNVSHSRQKNNFSNVIRPETLILFCQLL